MTRCPCAIIFRYWKEGQLFQLSADCVSVEQAHETALLTSKKCLKQGLEWVAELLPNLAEPIVLGSPFGLKHRRDLF